jgi:NitT/TauT family transport system permease protein
MVNVADAVAGLVSVDVTPERPERRVTIGRRLLDLLPPLVAFAVLIAGWAILDHLQPGWLLPGPMEVLRELKGHLGFYARHGQTTLLEAMGGLVLGAGVAFVAAVFMAQFRVLERALFPIAVVFQVTPVVAIVPILILWFGFGYTPKMVVAGLITFFPVLVNAIVGFRSVDPQALDVLDSLDASAAEVFWRLRLPNALPYLLAAAKVCVSLSIIGAVVAEWQGSSRGLGLIVLVAQRNLALPRMFAAIFSLCIMGVVLTLLVGVVERRLLSWHNPQP